MLLLCHHGTIDIVVDELLWLVSGPDMLAWQSDPGGPRWWRQWDWELHLLAMPIAVVERVSDVVGRGFASMSDNHGVL